MGERRSLSARALILGTIVSVAALGLAIVGAVTFVVQFDRVVAEVDAGLADHVEALGEVADLRVVVEDIGTSREPPDQFADVTEYLRAAVARLVPGPHEASMALIDGEVIFRTRGALGESIADDTAFVAEAVRIAGASTDATSPVIATARVNNHDLHFTATAVTLESEGIYVRVVDVAAELRPLIAALWTFIVAAIATLIAMTIAGWFVTGRILSPIRHVQETADAISLTDLAPRITAQGVGDISDLTRTVNAMLDRLETSVDDQRRLLDDVRHELKTPITIVRGHLEMMDAGDPADVTATREIGILELDRMTRLVDDIDLLSSADGDQFAFHSVGLGTLTRRMGDLVQAIPDHTWRVVRVARGTIDADADRLVQAWLQLADNAAKYTRAGTPIEIGSEIRSGVASLWVRDHGEGIAPEARERIFRRFDRAGNHRMIGGSGLGLAIVATIARAHNGTCLATETPGGGATFTITIPAASLRSSAALPREFVR